MAEDALSDSRYVSQLPGHVARIASFLAFLIIPFLGGNQLSLYVVTIDRFWIETSFLVLLVVALFSQYLAGRKPDAQYLKFFLVVLPLFTTCAVSLAYTWNTFTTLGELNLFVWIFASVLLYLISDDRDSLHKALIIGSLLLVLTAVIQLKVLLPELGRVFTGGKYGMMVRDQVAPFGAFLNQNMLGGYFLYALPLALYCAIVEEKWVYLFAAAGLILGILLSLSRLAMIIGFGTLFLSGVIAGRKFDFKWLWKVACAFGCAILLFGILIHGERREAGSSMRSLLGTKVESASTEITTLDRRTEVWGNALKAFWSKPVFGYGAGTFEYAYRKFYDGGLYTKYAHSSIVKTAVELGAAGILCFFLYLLFLGMGISRLVKGTRFRFLGLSAVAGLLFALLDFAFDMPAHVITFFVVTSVFLVPRAQAKPISLGRPMLLGLVALLLCSFVFTSKAGLARKSIQDGILYEEAGLFTDAYLSYRDAIQAMPFDNDGYTRIISILMQSYTYEKNLQNRERVRAAIESYLGEVDGRKHADAELYFTQGLAHALRAPSRDACRYMTTAISLYPSSAYYVFETAKLYIRLGDPEEALKVMGRIEPYVAQFKRSGNPQGLFVYKIQDLEADIEYRKGNPEKALALGRRNLSEGMSGTYAICSSKAREFLPKEVLIGYLRQKVKFYEEAVKQAPQKNAGAHGV